jgi:hypothetical protein
MQKMMVNIPARIGVADYHEFDTYQAVLRQLIPSVKVKEIGFAGEYVGMVYEGNIKDKLNASLLRELTKEVEEWEE